MGSRAWSERYVRNRIYHEELDVWKSEILSILILEYCSEQLMQVALGNGIAFIQKAEKSKL